MSNYSSALTALRETTSDWKSGVRIPCHTYLVQGDRMLAYIKEGTNEIKRFHGAKGQGLKFDRKGRTFTKVSLSVFGE